jgi:hypothetical protein
MPPRPFLAALSLAALLPVACTNSAPCPEPLETCGDTCYDLQTDRLNCGGCGDACPPGLGCRGGACVGIGDQACATRTGGAFVTLGSCGQSVKLWVTSAPFVARAEALRNDPASSGPAVPYLDLRDGTDCDAQWSWHVDAVTATFVAGPPTGECIACPSAVEDALAYRIFSVATWCPTSAVVLAVDRR